MSARRAGRPLPLSPLQGGRRATRRWRLSAPAALGVVLLAAVAAAVAVWAL